MKAITDNRQTVNDYEDAARTALGRAIIIQAKRREILDRRPDIEVVATRVTSVDGQVTTHHLVDLGRQHGRGKCCWIPPLPAPAS
jgi:hypothetical protein